MKFAQTIRSVLFDMDGTLLDTAKDLGAALNDLLLMHGLSPLPVEKVRSFAGRGSRGLIKLGFNIDDRDPRFARLSEQFMEFYAIHMCKTTKLFPGMDEVLNFLENHHIPWGVVTNKPERFSIPLLKHLDLDKRAACLVSGDSLAHRKPFPDPILHACQLIQCAPKYCLYIGDAEIDVIASNAAGTLSLVANYGYIPDSENSNNWQADGLIHMPIQIIDWIKDRALSEAALL